MLQLDFILNLSLDWERLGPLWEESQKRDGLNIRLVASNNFLSDLNFSKIDKNIWTDKKYKAGLGWLWRPNAIVTATESNLRPHKVTHKIVKQANIFRIPTITIQHGYECVGISYADRLHDKTVSIASKKILIWQEFNKLPSTFKKKINGRCFTSGYISASIKNNEVQYISEKLENTAVKLDNNIKLWVLVTENLHWQRYDGEYRETFKTGLMASVKNNPDIGFILKPHPAGLFLKDMDMQGLPDNLLLTSNIVKDKKPEPGIAAWLTCTNALITTPSTTAIDAAILNKPLLMVKNNLSDYWPYEPLYTLANANDWIKGIDVIRKTPDKLLKQSDQFLKEKSIKKASPKSYLDKIVSILQ